jgi:hypothetical protein
LFQQHHKRRRWHIAILFFFLNTPKNNPKNPNRKEGTYFQAPALPFHFWVPLLPFCFKCFLITSSYFQTKEKKTIKNKRNAEKGGSFPSSSRYAVSLLAPASTFPLLPFCFKRFFLASSSSQVEENKRKTRKKNRREKKNAKNEGSFPSNSRSALSFLAPTSALLFLPFRFKCFLLGILFSSSRRKEKKP